MRTGYDSINLYFCLVLFIRVALENLSRHPYLLPNVVGSGLALLSLPLVLIYLKDMRKVEGVVQT